MASYNDHLIANERVQQEALLLIASHMEMDNELIQAIAATGTYLNRLNNSSYPSEIARKGSKLQQVIYDRLNS